MAKSTTTRGKVSEIRDPQPPVNSDSETATAVMDPPEAETVEIPPTPFDERPPELPKRKAPPKAMTFFDRVQDIPLADWGTRAKIKLYRLAPIINRLVGSENKYITIYAEAITEEKIKRDHGSGRYRLYLNYKNAGERNEKEIDMIELDILDMNYPPKVPAGEWIDDDRNKQWAWARQPGMPAAPPPPPPPPASGVAELVNMLRVGSEMRKEIREEMQPAQTAAAPAAPAAPAPVDPWAAAEKILNMRSENPMVTLMQEQLKLSNLAAEAARDREFKSEQAARDREFKLQEKLLEASKAQQTAAAPKGLLEQLTEFAAITDKLEPLKRLFGGGSAEAAAPIRSGKFAMWDFAREVVPQVMNSKILNALADKIAASPSPQLGNPAAAPANGNGARTVDDTMTFVQHVVTPAMLLFYKDEDDGATFAEWLYGGHPARVTELQAYGEQRIFELYKNYAPRPDWTNVLAARGEPAFAQFIHEFCTWKPEEEEATQGSPAAPGQVNQIIDLDTDDDRGGEA